MFSVLAAVTLVQMRRVRFAMVAVGLVTLSATGREPVKPARTPFVQFPMSLPGGWSGRPDHLERDVLATLAVDDYFLANYSRQGEPWVNFYSAWYDSQSGGQSTHSPRTCIPGGGWAIAQLEESPLKLATTDDNGQTLLTVNRAIIQKGEQRQLVYYWFSQRGRALTSEVQVKWYILHDALRSGRTDGALVRLITPVLPTEDIAQSDRRLTAFLSTIEPRLRNHVPH